MRVRSHLRFAMVEHPQIKPKDYWLQIGIVSLALRDDKHPQDGARKAIQTQKSLVSTWYLSGTTLAKRMSTFRLLSVAEHVLRSIYTVVRSWAIRNSGIHPAVANGSLAAIKQQTLEKSSWNVGFFL